MQHKAAADGNADGWDGALKRRQKAADDDVEAKEQIRNAVMPERAHRVRDQLLPRVREIEAHELRRKDVKPEEEHRRSDANGRERIAQELSARGAVSPSVLEAHERLRALRDADHQLDDERRHIGNDRVGHNAVRTNIFEHRAVEEEDHQSRAQLRHAVGKADGQDARVKVRIEAEFAQPERALFAEKVRKVRDAGDKLGDARGDRRAENAHVEPENCDIVEHTVCQAPGDDGEERVAREAVRLDEHLKVVGHQIAHAERRKAEKIMLDIVERDLVRAEKAGERLQKQQHERRGHRAEDEQRGKIL